MQDQRGGRVALARWGWPGGLPPLPPASRAALAHDAATGNNPHLLPRVWLSWALLATAAQPQSAAQITTSHGYPSAGAAQDHLDAMFHAALIKAASTFHPDLYQRMEDLYGSQHVLAATQPDPDDDLPGWPSGTPPPDSQASDEALITWAGHRELAGVLAGGQARLALARLGLYDLPPLPPGAHDRLAARLLGAEIPQARLSYAMLLMHGPLSTAQAATFSGLDPGKDLQVIIRHLGALAHASLITGDSTGPGTWAAAQPLSSGVITWLHDTSPATSAGTGASTSAASTGPATITGASPMSARPEPAASQPHPAPDDAPPPAKRQRVAHRPAPATTHPASQPASRTGDPHHDEPPA